MSCPMKILFSSHFFHPSIGGIQEVGRILAGEFTRAGHEVQVVTHTAERDSVEFPFPIHRRPGALELLRLVEWCDVFFHNNISLRTAWPLLLRRRPWVAAHHALITRVDGRIGWQDRLKQRVVRGARNIVVSKALGQHIAAPAVVIGNPYRDDLFRCDPAIVRDRDLVFLGRLVPDKGADLLFQALVQLRERRLLPGLTVVGQGPAESVLRELSRQLGLESQIDFVGQKTGPELTALLNRHRVLVVPSRLQEPFGLVALEGMACGCIPLVANCGGLPDAIGVAGVTFRHEDAEDAARSIEKLLAPDADLRRYKEAAAPHLAKHTAAAVAAQYLRVLEEAAGR
ncbi:glycosyl transferase group 1 [Chthoniobacter flavus Ellin428]|uniref:Glycosyl transferase group 1 n=2 Tax=Chthoniobacter flavus TaxID=191863 RepID=B4D1K3_9BACT|nr:glycosyl transferase group 1 [Chthoniobacter flavus Ellin428]